MPDTNRPETLDERIDSLLLELRNFPKQINSSHKDNEFANFQNIKKYIFINLSSFIHDRNELQRAFAMTGIEFTRDLITFIENNRDVLTQESIEYIRIELHKYHRMLLQPTLPDVYEAQRLITQQEDITDTIRSEIVNHIRRMSDSQVVQNKILDDVIEHKTFNFTEFQIRAKASMTPEDWVELFDIMEVFLFGDDLILDERMLRLYKLFKKIGINTDYKVTRFTKLFNRMINQAKYLSRDLTDGFGGDLYFNQIAAIGGSLEFLTTMKSFYPEKYNF
ncbi:MAG: hypothetical protein ABIM99_03220 [Candidatus Dojkabacteria bacterium]